MALQSGSPTVLPEHAGLSCSMHIHGCSPPTVAPVVGNLMPFSGLAGMWYTDLHVDKTYKITK